jgi:hypothetical protein
LAYPSVEFAGVASNDPDGDGADTPLTISYDIVGHPKNDFQFVVVMPFHPPTPDRGAEVGPYFAVFQGTSNGGRQFLRYRRSNRHMVPLS